MTYKLLFRLPAGLVIGRVIGRSILPLLATVGFTSPSLAQEPVFSNDGMRWEGDAAAAANEFNQHRSVLAMDAARNLGARNMLILPAPDADEVARRMTPTDDAARRPAQTGFTRTVNGFAQLPPSPAGTQRGSDGRDYVVSQRLVGSAGAASVRLHFSGVLLPAGAKLYVYGLADDGAQHKVYDSAWLGDRASFWSHTVPGDRAVVEYHAPLDGGTTDRAASYTVDRVVHNVVDGFGHVGAVISSDAAACHLDMCDNQDWQGVGNGVMRLAFVRGTNTHFCSGALLNDRVGSGTPYIYTANHCISTQAEAATVELAYFYQRNSCADDPDSNTVTRLGSTLLVTGGAEVGGPDFTLLRASTPPPNGVTFLGWSTDNIDLGTRVTGIHHPRGDFKRISFGYKSFDHPGRLHSVLWSSGAAEGGSSGSPALINGPDRTSARVIGVLSGGREPSCSPTRRLVSVGKFSQAWPSFRPFLDNGGVPDVVVDNVSVPGSPLEPGTSFMINATVRNQGNGTSAGSTLRYYRSFDSTITTTDDEFATHAVGGLPPSGSSRESTTVVRTRPGGSWFGACVDAVIGETAINNNCSAGVQVIVVAAPRPDLIVREDQVSNVRPEPGVSFTISATVRNRGNSAAAETTLRYFVSTDSTINDDDTQLATDTVSPLAVDAFSIEDASVSITEAGTWWVGACVDAVNGETATGNNCSFGRQVNVAPPAFPDLTVNSVSVTEPSVEAGAAFTIYVIPENRGTGVPVSTTLRYYGSADSTITTSDTELANEFVETLAADTPSRRSASVSLPNAGSYWVGACVDMVDGETATDNNCSVGVQVTVTARPDNNNGIALLPAIIHLLLNL